ncbi:MAG TPA: hypothetical protein VF304_06345 [Casimicrobiaceae bacterium]
MNSGRARTTRSGEHAALLRSFWIAGFDGTDHFANSRSVDDGRAYRRRVEADYRRVRDAGVDCVHESIGWRRAERTDGFDFAFALLRAQCARQAGLQVIWTLCHAGWPDDVDVAAADFADRFARFACAAARALAPYADSEPPLYTPVNEIAFLSWAIAETSLFGPTRAAFHRRGGEIRKQLVRAALAGCDAILEVDPRARFLHREAAIDGGVADAPFDVFDMLEGRVAPQLGGHPRYLDVVGIHWHQTDAARPASGAPSLTKAPNVQDATIVRLLEELHARYCVPIVVSETNRTGAGRAQWLRQFGTGIGCALERGVPVIGAGLCRIVERPAWEDPRYWRERRLWDVLLDPGERSPYSPDSAYESALRDVRARIDPLVDHSHHRYTS